MQLGRAGTDVIEDVHGLPRGTIEAMGPETAAQLAIWIQQGVVRVTKSGKFAFTDEAFSPSLSEP